MYLSLECYLEKKLVAVPQEIVEEVLASLAALFFLNLGFSTLNFGVSRV
jgi:hypothetical protein